MQNQQGHDIDQDDPDRTESLPVLDDAAVDPDVADDAVPLPPDDHLAGAFSALKSELEALRASADIERARADRLAQEQVFLREELTARDELIAQLRGALAARHAQLPVEDPRRWEADLAQRRASTASVDAAPGAARWELVRLDLGETPATVLGSRTRLGRATGCELHIDSPSVSRYHALVVVDADGAVIEDLNSTNGIYVNGRKIMRERLRDGDSVTVGEAKFRVSGGVATGAKAP